MSTIGQITYRTLEEGVKKEWPVLDIIETNQSLYLHEVFDLKSEVASEVADLKEIVTSTMGHLFSSYRPFFPDLEYFKEIGKVLLCEQTFFENRASFNDKGDFNEFTGIYYPEDVIINGEPVKRGCYIKKEGRETLDVCRTVLHEYAHIMHDLLCGLPDLTPYSFRQYDAVMKEVFAITAEQVIRMEKSNREPYATAIKIIHALDKIPNYHQKPLYRKLKILLGYDSHKKLVRGLKHYHKKEQESKQKQR